MRGFIIPGGRNPHRGGAPGFRDGMRPRYASERKRGECTPEERQFTLNLLRTSRATADPKYVVSAAGFWLSRIAPHSTRAHA
jgi:hypothetical protein